MPRSLVVSRCVVVLAVSTRHKAAQPRRTVRRGGGGTVEPGFLATFDYVSGSGRLTRQFTVSVPLNGRAVVLSDEHSAYRWMNCSEIDRSSATAKTQGVVAAWFDWDQAENRRA